MALKITEVPESFTLQSLSLLQWYVAGIVKWEYDMSVHLNKWERPTVSPGSGRCVRGGMQKASWEAIAEPEEDWTNIQGRA